MKTRRRRRCACCWTTTRPKKFPIRTIPQLMNVETFKYDNRIVRAFAIATVIWGIVGFSAGLLIACQLFWPDLNLNLQFTSFGRLRPLHTNAVIFAFVGNGMFMGIYYSLQRLCKARMFSDKLSWINFWGWQL